MLNGTDWNVISNVTTIFGYFDGSNFGDWYEFTMQTWRFSNFITLLSWTSMTSLPNVSWLPKL